MAGETDGGRLVLMSTHGPGSSRNARESLATPRDLTRIADRLDSAAVGRPDAFVWAFKSGTSVMRADEPLRPGDVTVTTSKVGGEVVVERLFPVLAVLRNQPDVAGLLEVNWRGDGWDNIVLLDDPIVLTPPAPFAELDEAFDIRPGAMFAAKFIHASLDDFLAAARDVASGHPRLRQALLGLLARAHVLSAIEEYDQLGEDAFLEHYGFHRPKEYWLEHEGRRYASKAIVGAAVGRIEGQTPLRASEFSGGEATVAKALEQLGFVVSRDASTGKQPQRNPKWTWSEEVLLLEGYLRHGLVHAGTAEARVLSDELRRLKVHSHKARGTDFRSAAEVARRLVELSRAAPHFDGEPGWFDYHDQAIWERLDTDLDTISELAAVVRGGAIIGEVDTDGTVTLVAPRPRKQAARKTATAPDPNIEGGSTTTTTKVRKGQSKLRDYLLAQIGPVCLFTGEGPRQALDAAHLYSFAESQTHDVYGAALMRADLHKLFDRREKTLPRPLISINPESWTVWVHPDVRQYEAYGLLHDTEARGEWKDHIAIEYLHIHFRQAIEGA